MSLFFFSYFIYTYVNYKPIIRSLYLCISLWVILSQREKWSGDRAHTHEMQFIMCPFVADVDKPVVTSSLTSSMKLLMRHPKEDESGLTFWINFCVIRLYFLFTNEVSNWFQSEVLNWSNPIFWPTHHLLFEADSDWSQSTNCFCEAG